MIPSIDRKNSDKGYSINNIQILDLETNRKKGILQSVKVTSKKVLAIHSVSLEKFYFSSLSEASRAGYTKTSVSFAIKNGTKYKGLHWYWN